MINNRILAFREILQPLYELLKSECNREEQLMPYVIQWGENFVGNIPVRIIFYGRTTNGGDATWDIDKCFDLSDSDRIFAMGSAVTKKYLTTTPPICQAFVNWLNALYN